MDIGWCLGMGVWEGRKRINNGLGRDGNGCLKMGKKG